MTIRKTLPLLLTLLALLAGCATPLRLPVPPITEATRASSVLVAINQQEIQVDKPDINAGGGLIGALIEGVAESTMDKNRQIAIAPVRDALVDYNFDERFKQALAAKMPSALVRPDARYQVTRNQRDYEDALVNFAGANGIDMSVRYAFESNFRALYVDVLVRFGDVGHVRDKAGNVRPKYTTKAQSRNKVTQAQYRAEFPLSDSSGSYTPNVARWMVDRGAPMRAALEQGIAEVTALIERDLGSPVVYDPKTKKRWLRFFVLGGPFPVKFVPLEASNGRALFVDGPLLLWTSTAEVKAE